MSFVSSETTKNHLYPTNSYQSSSMMYPKNYGSNSNDTKITSSNNISPNDDDESLYLLWTHQILIEKGYKPSIISTNDDEENGDDDDDESTLDDENDDKELTNLFSTPPSISSPSLHTNTSIHYQSISSPSSSISSDSTSNLNSDSSFKSFFSWFTFCF
ncbi:hypothetical protein BJ944DRAFT_273288 [Cunninghamella echinulata]|nr:hypothetical protein BJ944DRAFT_273288 [Cunninghamella echinulata]